VCQKRYFAALSLLSTSSALAARFEQQNGFDHRVLYAAHDYIADYYRFSIDDCGDCGNRTLFESEAQWRDRLKAEWISFYESEVSRLADKDEFCVAVLTASAFQNLPEGRAAVTHLDTLLFLEYGEFSSSGGAISTIRLQELTTPNPYARCSQPLAVPMTRSKRIYEVRPRKDQRGVDLISDVLPFGALWYGDANAVANAIGYAEHFSRSHHAVIRVYDDTGNVIETHDHAGDFTEP
jgi:hypothetical protein